MMMTTTTIARAPIQARGKEVAAATAAPMEAATVVPVAAPMEAVMAVPAAAVVVVVPAPPSQAGDFGNANEGLDIF